MKFDNINSSLNYSFSHEDLKKQFNPEYKKNVPITIENVKSEAEKKLAEYNYYKNEFADSQNKSNNNIQDKSENIKKQTDTNKQEKTDNTQQKKETKLFPILKPD
jgi:hypothetical protein